MASKLNLNTALRNAKMDAYTAQVGNGGILRLYDNTAAQPSGPSVAVPGTSVKLAEWTCGTPFAPSSSNGILSPTLPANVNGLASGTPGWFRVFKSDGTTAVYDGSAGTTGCDMNLSGSVVSGQPVQINSWTHTDQNFGH